MDKFKLDFINRVRCHPLLRQVIFDSSVLDFIAAQFALESNFGTSTLAITRNNYCGMKVPHRRVTYMSFCDNADGFSSYTSFDNCVLDYVSWLFYQRPYQNDFQSLIAFKRFIQVSGYCPESDYIQRIDSIYNLISK